MTGHLLAAAVCPYPPMLVPEVCSGAVEDLAELRQACDEAIRTLLATRPDRVIVLGAGLPGLEDDETAGGTLAAYGVDLHVGGAGHELALSLAIGAWLLDRNGWTGPRTYTTARPRLDGRIALLVMADGSAKRTSTAPGFLDQRAEPHDAAIATALRDGDADALRALDPQLGSELWAAGVPALQTLGELTKGADIAARMRFDAAPFGVGYWVADWTID